MNIEQGSMLYWADR